MFKYFKIEEFDCQETGNNEISVELVNKLDELREACGFSFTITSGYRDPSHSIEAKKSKPGTHEQGIAADFKVADGAQRMAVVANAVKLGFTGIGVAKSFVHVDIRETTPVLWCY